MKLNAFRYITFYFKIILIFLAEFLQERQTYF